jgi:hypothetical protein
MTEAVEKAFEDAQKQSLEAVMILGLTENGGVTINSSLNNVAAMHWMLNKSIFDINVFERQPKEEKSPQAVDPEA